MALTVCRECKGSVADSAQQCPHCGVDDPDKIRHYGKIAGGCLVLAFIVLVVIGIVNSDDSPAQPASKVVCEVASANANDDSFVIDGELDYGYVVAAVVNNKGDAGVVALTATLTSSEGEFVRERTEYLSEGATTTVQFQFREPTINVTDVRYRVTCSP